MTAAVVVLALAVAVLGLLVAGVLRSHAEILRALHDLGIRVDGTGATTTAVAGAGRSPVRTRPGVPEPGPGGGTVTDLSGLTPDGDAAVVAVRGTQHRTLLAFLSSGCLTCRHFWEEFQQPDTLGLPDDVRLVVVAKDPEQDSPSAIARLAPAPAAGVPVLLSAAAWDDYAVPVAPYFVLVDGPSGQILGEGASARWEQVRDLMLEAVEDRDRDVALRARPGAQGRRDADADEALHRAGIRPGDPRLHHEPDDR